MRKLLAVFALCLLPVAAPAQQAAPPGPPSDSSPGASNLPAAARRTRFEYFGVAAASRFRDNWMPGGNPGRGAGVTFLTVPPSAFARFLPAAAVQGGSGTVNGGTAGRFAFYASTGTAVSESPRLSETGGNTLTYSGSGGLDLTGSTDSGQVQLSGATSGTVTLSVRDAAGTYTFKLPDSAGTSGQVLTTDGAGATTWTTPAGGGTSGSSAFETLTSGPTVNWSFSGSERRKARLTLGTNAALSLPGVASGSEGDLYIQQDATGGHTLALPAGSYVSGGGSVNLSAAPGAVDKLHFAYDGTNFYWDAPVLNYVAAGGGGGHGIALSGTTGGDGLSVGVSGVPNTSAYTAATDVEIVGRLRGVRLNHSATQRVIMTDFMMLYIPSGSTNLTVGWGSASPAVNIAGHTADIVFRVRRSGDNVTLEVWDTGGSSVNAQPDAGAGTGGVSFRSADGIGVGRDNWQNGGNLQAKIDWLRVGPTVSTYGGPQPTGASTSAYTLARWEFDQGLSDSSGNGIILSPVNTPVYDPTP